jgi:hypothetical protein
MIPYIPDDHKSAHPHQVERDQLFQTYDKLRRINTEHQSKLATQLLEKNAIASIAKCIGIMDADGGVFVDDDENDIFEALAPAFDLALYAPDGEGQNAVQHYAQEMLPLLTEKERCVLAAMGDAKFSIFRVDRKHEIAGVWLTDTVNGGEVWLVDRGFDANAQPGMIVGTRLFKPDDFWMSTGLAVPTDLTIINANESKSSEKLSRGWNKFDNNKLAEDMYRGFFGEAA